MELSQFHGFKILWTFDWFSLLLFTFSVLLGNFFANFAKNMLGFFYNNAVLVLPLKK